MFKDYFLEVTSDMLESDKINLIKANIERANKLNNDIKKLETAPTNNANKKAVNDLISKAETLNKEQEKDTELESIYNKISLLDISELTDEEIEEEFNKIISKENIRYNALITKLKIMLHNEIVIYSNMVTNSETLEEINDLRNAIKEIKEKIQILNDLGLEKELIETKEENNNIFFLVNENDKVIILESLRKNVPFEYYPQFKELLLSIKNGTFKGLKKLKNIIYFEVKDFKIRITFDKLSNGNYIVIDAFMKKEDISNFYRNKLTNREDLFLKSKNYYLENLSNPAFLEKHNDYFVEIMSLLDTKEAVLGGDNSDERTI